MCYIRFFLLNRQAGKFRLVNNKKRIIYYTICIRSSYYERVVHNVRHTDRGSSISNNPYDMYQDSARAGPAGTAGYGRRIFRRGNPETPPTVRGPTGVSPESGPGLAQCSAFLVDATPSLRIQWQPLRKRCRQSHWQTSLLQQKRTISPSTCTRAAAGSSGCRRAFKSWPPPSDLYSPVRKTMFMFFFI